LLQKELGHYCASQSSPQPRPPDCRRRSLVARARKEVTSGRRPGDVTIPIWKDSKGLAVDVAVTSTFSRRNLTLPCPADAFGLRKHAKYDEGFRGSRHLFCAAVLETTGGYSEEALSFFRQLFPVCRPPAVHQALCVRWPGLGQGSMQRAGFSCSSHPPQSPNRRFFRKPGFCAQAGSGAQQQGIGRECGGWGRGRAGGRG